MTHRARTDTLNDSWLRRGYADPPPFAESLPDVWLNVELNFYRRTGSTKNNIGGFKGEGVTSSVWITHGHAELITGQGLLADNLSIGVTKRHYELITPMPTDPASIPRKGDRVWWYDATGRRLDQPVMSVTAPEGFNDHLEIDCDEFE